MLMKIGDITNKFGISHRALHYWEDAGILTCTRGENGYRYYDEENLHRIKQIVLLRKLHLSIPSIHAIFASEEMARVIDVFTDHLDETEKEKERLDALSLIVRQIINMLRDRQEMTSVYNFLDSNHSVETEELKAALQRVFTEEKPVAMPVPAEPEVDMTDVDITLELLTEADLSDVAAVIRRCYAKTDNVEKIIEGFHFEQNLHIKDCAWCYKIMQAGQLVGAVSLIYVGKEAMLIQEIAYNEPDNNIYIFERLKELHPEVLCWNILFADEAQDRQEQICYIEDDYAGKRAQFRDDNGFTFYTNSRGMHYIKMMKPHDEVYNSSRYRFALLDGSMDGVGFRFFGAENLDFYDGVLTGLRLTDVNFQRALIFDADMSRARIYNTGICDSEFRFGGFERSNFHKWSFTDCVCTECDVTGMKIDGIDVNEAIAFYKQHRMNRKETICNTLIHP